MLKPPPFPVSLTDGEVVVRTYRDSDAGSVFEAASESRAEILPWMDWIVDYSPAAAAAWVESRAEAWERGTECSFVICSPGGDDVLGTVGLNRFNDLHRNANLGYWVRTAAVGRGVGTRATLLAARFGFESLGLVRIEIHAGVANIVSRRVAEKAGAVFEGVRRNGLLAGGRPDDAALYSLIPADL